MHAELLMVYVFQHLAASPCLSTLLRGVITAHTLIDSHALAVTE